MEYSKYQILIRDAFKLYGDGKVEEAYKLITDNKDIEGGKLSVIYEYRFSLAYALGKNEEGLKLFKEALLEHNLFYPTRNLLNDPTLTVLREDPSFPELLELCRERNEAHRYSGKPELHIKEPGEEYLKNPRLLIAIHGNNQTFEIVKEKWNPDNYDNHIVAYPISSELTYTNGHVWTDIEQGVQELKMHYDTLVKKYDVKSDDITICSFFTGASILMDCIVNDLIEAKKLILFRPWFANFENLKGKLNVLKEKNIDVYIECGDKDVHCFSLANAFSKELDKLKVNYKYTVIEGLKFDYPENFDEVQKDIQLFLYKK
jgi:predicted esterase